MFLLPEVHILGPFSDIYDNGENPSHESKVQKIN